MGMKRYLLDSNAVTAMLRRHEPFIVKLELARRSGCRIGTCEPIVAELLFGLELSSSRDENRIRLQRGLSELVCWPLDRSASEVYGRLAAELRRRGRAMQTIDILMAAIALSLGDCAVVTVDSDLYAIPGLVVENWEA
jgi:tRNA(fMet)-specific endonuclease VapC